MGSYWPSSGSSILRQVDWFSVHRWPGMEFGPNGPFPGQNMTRVFLECPYSPSVWTRARNEASLWAILMQILRKIQLLSCGRVKQSSFWMASHAQGLTPGVLYFTTTNEAYKVNVNADYLINSHAYIVIQIMPIKEVVSKNYSPRGNFIKVWNNARSRHSSITHRIYMTIL